jgi:hypothetical protein
MGDESRRRDKIDNAQDMNEQRTDAGTNGEKAEHARREGCLRLM